MSEEVRIDVFGDEVFRRRILDAGYRAVNMKPVLERVKEHWLESIEEQFGTEGERGLHRKWKELMRSTVLRRGSAHPILIEHGDLLLNVTDPAHTHVDDNSVRMDIPPEVAARAEAHQFGFSNVNAHNASAAQQIFAGTRDVPARPWMVITDKDERQYRDWITDYLVNGRLA